MLYNVYPTTRYAEKASNTFNFPATAKQLCVKNLFSREIEMKHKRRGIVIQRQTKEGGNMWGLVRILRGVRTVDT